MTKSFVESGFFIHDNVEESARIGAQFLNQEFEVVNSVLSNPPDRITTNELYPVLDDLETMQAYLTKNVSAMSGKIDLEKFVDLSYAGESGAK